MICSIHQPQFNPWLGYIAKIDQADVFVFLDDTQYKKNEWQNRNKIRTKEGWQWLTVPVSHKFGEKISEIKINNNINWTKKHYQSLKTNYGSSKYFKDYELFFDEFYSKEWLSLMEVNIYLIKFVLKSLDISTKTICSSEFNIPLNRNEKLVEICKKVGADTYLSGMGGKSYLDIEMFERNQIKVIFQNYTHPKYEQCFQNFEPYMGIIDLLFNYGKDSLNIVKEGR